MTTAEAGSRPAARATIWPQVTLGRIRLALLVYGLALCVFGVWHLDHHPPARVGQLIGQRASGIAESLAFLQRGGPPLLGSLSDDPSGWYPLGAGGDDRGPYLYVTALGHAMGTSDPRDATRWFFFLCFGSLLLVYPLVFYELFGSLAAGIGLPLLLFVKRFQFLHVTDVYWTNAWAVLLGLPLLFLLYKKWRGWPQLALPGLVVVVVLGSLASSLRANAGLPILLAALALLLMREKRWPRRIFTAAVLLVAYISVSGIALKADVAARNRVIGPIAETTNVRSYFYLERHSGSGHTLWHTAYIGLGYLPNPYGLRYDDSVAFEAAKRANPNVVFLTRDYERVVRHLYFRFARKHPGFVARSYLAKAEVLAVRSVVWLPLLLVFLPVMVLRDPSRRDLRRLLLLTVPALIVGPIPAIVALPSDVYAAGWYGAVAVVWLLAAAYALSRAGAVLSRVAADGWLPRYRLSTSDPRRWPGYRRPAWRRIHLHRLPPRISDASRSVPRRTLVIAALAAAIFAALSIASVPGVGAVNVVDQYRQFRGLLGTEDSRHVQAYLQRWNLRRGLPGSWLREPKVKIENRDGATAVTTLPRDGAYQLVAPETALVPGEYVLSVRATPTHGGMGVGIVDTVAGEFVAQANYWSGQYGFDRGAMKVEFVLAQPTKAQVVLYNWNPLNGRSSWLVHQVTLMKLKPPCGCSPPKPGVWLPPPKKTGRRT